MPPKKWQNGKWAALPRQPTLAAVCKFLRREALRWYYHGTVFKIGFREFGPVKQMVHRVRDFSRLVQRSPSREIILANMHHLLVKHQTRSANGSQIQRLQTTSIEVAVNRERKLTCKLAGAYENICTCQLLRDWESTHAPVSGDDIFHAFAIGLEWHIDNNFQMFGNQRTTTSFGALKRNKLTSNDTTTEICEDCGKQRWVDEYKNLRAGWKAIPYGRRRSRPGVQMDRLL